METAQGKTLVENRPAREAARSTRRFPRFILRSLAVACVLAASAWYVWGWTQVRSAEDDIAHWRNDVAVYKTENFPYPFDRSWQKNIIRAKAFRRDCDIVSASAELDLARQHGAPAKVLEEEELLLDAHRGKIDPVRLRYESARDTIAGNTEDYCHSIAMGYLATLEFEQGMSFTNEWAQAHPGSMEPNVALARFLIEGRNYPAAIARLEKTLEVNPDHNAARFLLIQALGKRKQTAAVLSQYARLMNYPEHRVVAQLGYADTLARLGRIDEAEESLAALERDFPETKDSPRAGLVRSQICMMRGEFQTAATLLERYLKSNPHDLTARFQYGTALNRLGRFDEAETYMSGYQDEALAEEALSELAIRVKRFPDDLNAKVELAGHLLTLKEHDRAVDLLAEVFLRDPLHESAYNMMVEHFTKTDQLDKLQKIVDLRKGVLEDKAAEAKKSPAPAEAESSKPAESSKETESPKQESGGATSTETPSP